MRASPGFAFGAVLGLTACVATGPRKAAPDGCVVLDWGDSDATHPHRILHQATGIELVYIPPGAFEMGARGANISKPNKWGGTRHYRLVRNGFYLGVTEVTVGQWRKYVAESQYQSDLESGESKAPGRVQSSISIKHDTVHMRKDQAAHKDARWDNPLPNRPDFELLDTHPVTQLTHDDAWYFARHFDMNLPTEVQWEYAFRAGDSGSHPKVGPALQNHWDSRAKAAFDPTRPTRKGDGYAFLAPCGSYQPSPWGLHDMVGNVSEWCEDVWVDGDKYIAVDEEAQILHSRSHYGDLYYVVRGSSWTQFISYAKYAFRDCSWGPTCDRGFRVVINLPAQSSE